MLSKFLQELPQYHFDRNEFVDTFKKVFTTDEISELETACRERRWLDDFCLFCVEDEFYIFHIVSGTVINWYKNLGRANTCNMEGFGIADLQALLEILKEQI